MFSERLDFLMRLTGTRASALARATRLDGSYISRLRNGSRPLPQKPVFLSDMGAYFAKRIKEEYQVKSLCDVLNLHAWPEDDSEGSRLITDWLSRNSKLSLPIEPFLKSFAASSKFALGSAKQKPEVSGLKRFYFGNGGKREAVLHFFALLLKEKTPRTLFLSSDEDMSWLYEDPAFAARWAADFTKILAAGNRVRIIHHISRDFNELFEAVSKWIPVYMTGMIEPYYYPRLRDGILRRTLFIVPGLAAVVSSSVEKHTEGMLNELITEREALEALYFEYENYFGLCRPLMKIYTPMDYSELWDKWKTMAMQEGELVCLSAAPSLVTMPRSVAEAMQERSPGSLISECRRRMLELISLQPYTEITPDMTQGISSRVSVAQFLRAPELSYTPEEKLSHLENYSGFFFGRPDFRHIESDKIPEGILMYAKAGAGVIMVKTDSPEVAFFISEPNIGNAFWDYIKGMI